MENKEESEYINKIIIYIIDSMIDLFNEKNIDIFIEDYRQKEKIITNFDLFDNNIIFYSNLLNTFKTICFFKNNILENVKPIINQRNLLIFLDYLRIIILEFQEAYKNPIIKLNIFLIVSYFCEKKGNKIINSAEYFYICQKEIEKIYKKKCNIIKTIFDNKWVDIFNKKIEAFKQTQLFNLKLALTYVQQYYIKKKDYSNYEEISEIFQILKENNNLDIENDIIGNNKYNKHFSLYFQIKAKENGYPENHNEYEMKTEQIFKNRLYFKDIFKIDLNNMKDLLCLLSMLPLYNFSNIFNSINDIYKEYKNNYELLLQESKEDLTDELNNILKNPQFYEKFKKILESKLVKGYFLNKRKFINDNNIIIVDNSIEDYDDDLSYGYTQFMLYFNKDKNWFHSLIIFKYLPKNKRAFVDPNMRIILNPLFIQISDSLKKDKIIKEKILESYLILILIHEIAHLLKFIKENYIYFENENIPQTPKEKEGGEMLIQYLFGIPVINKISFLEAKEILNEESWHNIDKLHSIFNKVKKKELETQDQEKYNDNNLYQINYCLSDINDEEKDDDDDENDHWYDIN